MKNQIIEMMSGWTAYAVAYQNKTGMAIGDDCVLGKRWRLIAVNLVELMDGDTGDLDCDMTEKVIDEFLKMHKCKGLYED